MTANSAPQAQSKDAWYSHLQDRAALMANPGGHHRALIEHARVLYGADMINRDELSDLLEQADGALAYAVEALLDEQEAG
ncbi:hypothetical protein [Pseudomonas lurida]|uniref:DUF2732 domain-containing protein n=1 Tax=Pseudomonas lurida TaxID=244566 RepID=A0ABY9FS31_9PSED|nr:hypothetical protein [Pseudomonas lurida]WLH06112.1 hypothetical protein PSH67_25325 [Pseudomonas lurida]